jgi:hypothetical protein
VTEVKVGYWGCPPRRVLEDARAEYPGAELVDLDVDCGSPPSRLVPDATCQIITNIMDNAARWREELAVVVASVGEEKCDAGHYVARLCRDLGLNVIEARNPATERRPVRIAASTLPLREKVTRIMDTVHTRDDGVYEACKPTHGFWGVPPHDLRLLDLFPPTTHVYGWTRCVEAEVPADLDLEMHVDPKAPTVFYSQSFCPKAILARHLAARHGGLAVDADGPISGSVIAKVEAFLRLR